MFCIALAMIQGNNKRLLLSLINIRQYKVTASQKLCVWVNLDLLMIWTNRALHCLKNPLYNLLHDVRYNLSPNKPVYLVPLCSVRLRFSASSFCLRASSSCVSFCFSCVERLCPALTSSSGVCREQRVSNVLRHSLVRLKEKTFKKQSWNWTQRQHTKSVDGPDL